MPTDFRQRFVLTVILVSCLGGVVPAEDRRPPESELPAYLQASPSDLVFPSESLLPVGFIQTQRPAASADTSPTESPVTDSQLPGESQLPQASVDSNAQDTPGDDPARPSLDEILQQSRDRLPWLRLTEAEHTAPIRTIEFDSQGNNLFTAGEDKIVHHWLRGEDAEPTWRHQATYRWQVQRAELGTLLSLAVFQDQLFMGGFGAEGQQGEIVGVNTQTGAWLAPVVDPEQGHFSPVLNVRSFPTVEPRRLVSSDQKLGIALWQQDLQQGTWSHEWVREPVADAKFRFAPLDSVGSKMVVAPSRTTPWSIELIDVETKEVTKRFRRNALMPSRAAIGRAIEAARQRFLSQGQSFSADELVPTIRDFYGDQITAVAASRDERFIAAADDAGLVYLWSQDGQLLLKDVASFEGFLVETIRFSADLRYMALAATNVRTSRSIVQLWKLEPKDTPTLERELEMSGLVHAIALSPDGRNLVIGHGRRIKVWFTDSQEPPQALPARETIVQPRTVAFANEMPYRWHLTWPDAEVAFHGEEMSWLDDSSSVTWNTLPKREQDFSSGPFRLTRAPPSAAGEAPQQWVFRGDSRLGRLDLDEHYATRPGSRIERAVWIKNASGGLNGIAITMNDQNDIWYFARPDADGQRFLLRRVLRGHDGSVLSLDISPDQRYLISCAEDSTIRLWPLVGLVGEGAPLPDPRASWGFTFDVVDDAVVARNPIFTGPLYVRGLRDGDQLDEISYETHVGGGQLRRTTFRDPQEMVDFLNEPRFDRAVRFVIRRGGAPVPGFQAYPHWREIAAQVIAADREWALWTPSGHYDASFNGNRLFGWQINRGLEQEPDFYRADRFQAILERPDLMRRLLSSGSIEQASRLVASREIGFGQVLQNAIALQPEVNILSPVPGQVIVGRETVIRAEIHLQAGQRLATAKGFVSGVAAQLLPDSRRETVEGDERRIELSWSAKLPADRTLKFQVFCATEEKLVGAASVTVPRARAVATRAKPKLHVISAGISQYRDSRIPRLESGASNAAEFLKSLVPAASSMYDVQSLLLVDSSLTRNVWRSTLRQLEGRLRNSQPDDLIVIFLSGHGMVDEARGEYFYVTADARYSDLSRGNYQACLSFDELLSWNDIPCRKIAILDTCHSGAIQGLDMQHLKTAVRSLESDMVLTLTASEGNQLAAEYRGAQASLFTEVISDVLRQAPDTDGDGRCEWSELVRLVRDQVIRQSASTAVPQFPTAGPPELLQVVELPLARRESVVLKESYSTDFARNLAHD